VSYCGTGESLRRRLPRHPELALELLSRAVDPWERHDAGGSTSRTDEVGDLLGVEVTSAPQRAMLAWLLGSQSGPMPGPGTSSIAEAAGGATWVTPLRSELAVHVPSAGSSRWGNRTDTASLCSRSYIRQVGGRETRVATICVADDS